MTKSFFSLRIVASIVACLAVSVSVFGQNIPDEYLGTWEIPNNEAGESTKIERNTFYHDSFYGGRTTYRIAGLERMANPDAATKSRFPNGIKMELVLVSGDVDPSTIGSKVDRYAFINADKKSLVYGWKNQQGGITVSNDPALKHGVQHPPEGTFNGVRYEVVNTPSTWFEAHEAALGKGGHLAVVTSADEQEFVLGLIQQHGNLNFYWLGGYWLGDRSFKWITDETSNFANWAPGRPDNYQGMPCRK